VSYILEALRKMERQRRHESDTESWVEDVSAEPEEERDGRKGPGFIIIGVSIFFGICGVLTGVLLYQGDSASDQGGKVTVNTAPSATSEKAKPTPGNRKEKAEVNGQPTPLPRHEEGKKGQQAKPKGVTLSAIKEAQPPPTLPAKVAKGQPTLPPVIPEDAPQKRAIDTVKDAQIPKPEKKEDVMAGTVLIKPEVPPPEKKQEDPAERPSIDLTRQYKLTSTGEVNDRKYATIESNDYFIGDAFMGMTVSDIQRDRVYLKKEGSSRRYVIIFRY
jgi:hypothetical protein